MKNYDLVQDRFFIYNAVINIPLKKDSYIIFEYIFNSEYINIPLVINLKIDDVLEKDFNIHLKEFNKITHMFKLEYNTIKINFYLYLYNNEIYNDEKMEYLKRYCLIIKKLNLIYFLLYKYMAYCYRKNVTDTVNDIKLKTQVAALTLKLSKNNDNISSNKTKIADNETDISSSLGKIGDNETNISSNLEKTNSVEEINLKVSNNVFNDKYDIEKQSFNFNKNSHSYILFQKVFEYDFNTDGELIINNSIHYKYDNLENDINRLTHLYEFYNNNILFCSITLDNHDFSISNFDENILKVNDNFCFDINNKNNIKLVLTLTRINEWGSGNIKLKMIDDNYMSIAYKVKTDISNKFNENDKKFNFLMKNFQLIIL